MTDPLEKLVSGGMLVSEVATDEEIAGVWTNALGAYGDARTHGLSDAGRVVRAYDAGRLAAYALVRARDLKARAQNHHEVTLTAAVAIGGAQFERAMRELSQTRRVRNTLEYGWEQASARDAEQACAAAGQLLSLAASVLRAQRPAIASRITAPQ
ncbi:MAG: hypothetical protein JO306_13505 [Gemmatimonadetes bacterium]|nr:hypothetical protein [Gemmatimonadota bacterium]